MKKIFIILGIVIFIILCLLVATDYPQCGGKERWDIKVCTDSTADFVELHSMQTDLSFINHIPFIKVEHNAPRYPIEYFTVQIKCHILFYKKEKDSDYHLVLTDGLNTMIAESPNPECPDAKRSVYHTNFELVRNFINHIEVKKRGVKYYPINNKEYTITGILFRDFPHGQAGHAKNYIELHPIINIYETHYIDWDQIEKEIGK